MFEHEVEDSRFKVAMTKTEKTYRELRSRVLSGEYEPGTRLVNRTLAETLAVSLAPVREAVHRLATEGLVDYVPGAGAFVRNANSKDLEELYVLREAIEGCAAWEAARNITTSQLESLRRILESFEGLEAGMGKSSKLNGRTISLGVFDQWIRLEERFHGAIVEGARNKLLAKVIDANNAMSRIFGFQRQCAEILTREVAVDTCREHRAIVESIGSRNEEQARNLMWSHIRKGHRTVLEKLRQ